VHGLRAPKSKSEHAPDEPLLDNLGRRPARIPTQLTHSNPLETRWTPHQRVSSRPNTYRSLLILADKHNLDRTKPNSYHPLPVRR